MNPTQQSTISKAKVSHFDVRDFLVVFCYCCCYVLLKTSLTGTALVELLSRRPLDTFGVSLSLFKNATKSRTVFILSGGSIESIPMYLYIRCTILFLLLPRKPAFTIDKIYTARQFLFKKEIKKTII